MAAPRIMVVCCPLGLGEELLDASRYGYTNHPPEEALEVDYDPWAAYEGPDRSGKLERPKRRTP